MTSTPSVVWDSTCGIAAPTTRMSTRRTRSMDSSEALARPDLVAGRTRERVAATADERAWGTTIIKVEIDRLERYVAQ